MRKKGKITLLSFSLMILLILSFAQVQAEETEGEDVPAVEEEAKPQSFTEPSKKHTVGIISALDAEIELLLEKARISHIDHYGEMDFHVGKLCGQDVVIVKAGVGKVRAAGGAATLLDRYQPSEVIFTGIAGGVGDETKVLDVVVGTDLVQHDYGMMTDDGFVWSMLHDDDGTLGYYYCDPGLVSLAQESAASVVGAEHVFTGTIATGDQFVMSETYVKTLQEDFHAIACEMEGAAVASICEEFGVPYVVIRTMSDKADGLAPGTMEGFREKAADRSCMIVMTMLQQFDERTEPKIPVKVLIIPKFEIGEMKGDSPGEAQLYYERYLDGGSSYEIPGTSEDCILYEKDGVALFVAGMGKVKSSLNTMAVLSDERFDFSDCCVISVGCGGSAKDFSVMGDVIIGTAAADYDLGHHVDSREMAGEEQETETEGEKGVSSVPSTWFHEELFDSSAVVILNPDLTRKVYELVKDVKLETTDTTRAYMKSAFKGEEWAEREPQVLKGTVLSDDNYWKGEYGHANALKIVETYGCPDPYALAEMEDVAIANALRQMGLLDHYLIIRDSVNMDVFMAGTTPEILWGSGEKNGQEEQQDGSIETADIFCTAMENNSAVGNVVIDAVLSGELRMSEAKGHPD